MKLAARTREEVALAEFHPAVLHAQTDVAAAAHVQQRQRFGLAPCIPSMKNDCVTPGRVAMVTISCAPASVAAKQRDRP